MDEMRPVKRPDLPSAIRIGAAPLTTTDEQELHWALRNVEPIAHQTMLETKQQASFICEAAIAFLARNTLGRSLSASQERSSGKPYGMLLNLPVGGLVEFVQRELILKGLTKDIPSLDDFTQPKWKRYWPNNNVFHEDIIRFLLRPNVQLHAVEELDPYVIGRIASGRTAKRLGDGSPVIAPRSFDEAVGLAAIHYCQELLNDPVRQLGLIVQVTLASHPAVREASEKIEERQRSFWFRCISELQGFPRGVVRPKLTAYADDALVYFLLRLIDGYMLDVAIHGTEGPQGFRYPQSLFLGASMMAIGHKISRDDLDPPSGGGLGSGDPI
jgi:hypothetical protein